MFPARQDRISRGLHYQGVKVWAIGAAVVGWGVGEVKCGCAVGDVEGDATVLWVSRGQKGDMHGLRSSSDGLGDELSHGRGGVGV